MSLSEFRYNKKRKHKAYLFKKKGEFRKNILLTTKPFVKKDSRNKPNIKFYRHPNKDAEIEVYVEPRVYTDHINSFDSKIYKWDFDKNDKRKIKKSKRRNKNVGIELRQLRRVYQPTT